MRCWVLVMSVLLMPSLAAAQVNALPSTPHLLVKGHAEGRYVPDRFTIKLQIESTNMAPDLARERVEAHMQRLFKALDASGALSDRTHATSLSIDPNTEYRNERQVFVGTKVSRSLDATFDSIDKLRRFIAQVPADKEVQIQHIDVDRSDIDKLRQDLRQRAIENSRQAADQIASAYGLSIKGVYSVSEVAPDFSYGIRAGTLQTIVVTGSQLHPDAALRVGTMDEQQDIYVVYLTGPKQ